MIKKKKNPTNGLRIALGGIIVTVVTSVLINVFTGFFSNLLKNVISPETSSVHNLVINKIEYSGAVRLKINMNGKISVYPAGNPWVGSQGFTAGIEKIPLPADADAIHINITAQVRSESPKFQGMYETKFEEVVVGKKALPTGPQSLFSIPNSGVQGVHPPLNMEYAFE